MPDQEFLSVSWFQWLGGGLSAAWLYFFGRLYKMINERPTYQELNTTMKNARDLSDEQHKAIDNRMDDLEARQDRARDDLHNVETRLTTEIHNSETRLMAALQRRRDD